MTRQIADDDGVLRLVLAVNIFMYLVSLVIDFRQAAFAGGPLNLLSPSNTSLLVLGSTGSVPLFGYHRWWSLLTANYLHGGLLHIAFNMIALRQIGPLLLREYGPSRTIAIFTLSGIGGYLVSALFGVRFTIGASAAVCGLIGAALTYGKTRGGVYGTAIYRQVGGWAMGIFLFGFLIPGINNYGHAGGMLAGALTGYLLGYRERSPETIVHRRLAAVCVIATGLALLWSLVNGVFYLLLR